MRIAEGGHRQQANGRIGDASHFAAAFQPKHESGQTADGNGRRLRQHGPLGGQIVVHPCRSTDIERRPAAPALTGRCVLRRVQATIHCLETVLKGSTHDPLSADMTWPQTYRNLVDLSLRGPSHLAHLLLQQQWRLLDEAVHGVRRIQFRVYRQLQEQTQYNQTKAQLQTSFTVTSFVESTDAELERFVVANFHHRVKILPTSEAGEEAVVEGESEDGITGNRCKTLEIGAKEHPNFCKTSAPYGRHRWN